MAELVVSDAKNPTEKREPIDLICVIDRSGSMQGEKWSEVVQTIRDLTTFLKDFDRVSIISFSYSASRDCRLIRMSEEGK